jgi:hypothetical protein
MLVPTGQSGSSPGVLKSFEAKHHGTAVQAYVWSRAREESYIFFADQPGSWQLGPWASDGRLVLSSIDANKNLKQFIISDGSYLEFCGQRVFSSKFSVARAEWSRQASGDQFSCSDDSATTLRPSLLTVQHC